MPNPNLARLFAEHDAPKHCDKRKAHDGLKPINALVSDMQKQMIEYRAALAEELLTDDSAAGVLEHIQQTIEAGEREVAALANASRNVAKVFTQLDRYMAERKR